VIRRVVFASSFRWLGFLCLERMELHGALPVFAEYIRSSSLVCRPGCLGVCFLGVCLSMQAWSGHGAEAIVSGPTVAVRGPASHHESPTVETCHHDDAVHDCTSRQILFFFASRLERSYSICTVLSYLFSPCKESPSLKIHVANCRGQRCFLEGEVELPNRPWGLGWQPYTLLLE